MLKKVRDFDSHIPKGKFGFTGLRWSLLFITDFFFGLSNKRDKEGELIKRYDNPGKIGNWFRNVHEDLTKKLLENNKEVYDGTLSLPSIDKEHFNKQFFSDWVNQTGMPIVVKGYLSGVEAIEETTIESLVKNHGAKEVSYLSNSVNSKNKNRIGQNVEIEFTTLSDYLTKEEYKQYYLNNFYGILSDEDFLLKSRGKEINSIRKQWNLVTQWFISRRKTSGTTLHCASVDNMFLNLHGKKEWFFIDPSYYPILKPALSKYGIYSVSELQEPVGMGDDFYEVLIKDYPYFKYVPIFRYELEPGDLLYNPSNWWHTVRNQTDYTVGCAVRYLPYKISANSWTIVFCLLLDVLKHPKRTSLSQSIRLLLGSRKARKSLINTLYSANTKKRSQEANT